MYTISRFRELLNLFPRGVFDAAVRASEADKHRKGFSCWQQLVVMVYGQLTRAGSVRALLEGFNAQRNHHYHLGCSRIARSTLCDANAKEVSGVFERAAAALLQQVGRTVRREGTDLLRLIDSTSITLKGRGFDEWTLSHRTRHTQGLKLHVLYAPAGKLPLDQWITAANVNDLEYGRGLHIERGVTYVFDKAYCDYSWWWRMQCSGALFVTRLKTHARITVHRSRRVPRAARDVILSDEQVLLSNRNPGAGRRNPYTKLVRRIELKPQTNRSKGLVLLTNDLRSPALKIAAQYCARWQIELFFKWIKQHLKIKQFLGRTEQAVRIQILTALIAYLLVAIEHRLRGERKSLWIYLSELSATLFQRPTAEHARHRRWRERKAHQQLMQRCLFA